VTAAIPDDRPCLILGPTGSGKSTLLRLLAGSLKPSGGSIDGAEPAAYLPQRPERALAGRNLAEDLCGELRPGRQRRALLRRALGRVGLSGVALSRRSRMLSAGERRRLALALLLLSDHRHWALDEPESGLDATGVGEVAGILAARAREGTGRLWIATHRFEVHARLRPWTVVLERGRLLAAGELRTVCALPAVSEALSLSARAPFRIWARLSGMQPDLGAITDPLGAEHRLESVRELLEERAGLS
jgi:ABC-type multidrug transport system ATPase subunit